MVIKKPKLCIATCTIKCVHHFVLCIWSTMSDIWQANFFLPDMAIVHVNQKQMLLPVAWAVTQPSFHYIRVHRREVIFELFQPTCSSDQIYKWKWKGDSCHTRTVLNCFWSTIPLNATRLLLARFFVTSMVNLWALQTTSSFWHVILQLGKL